MLGGAGLALSAVVPVHALLSHCTCTSGSSIRMPIDLLGGTAIQQVLLFPYIGGGLVAVALAARALGAHRLYQALVHSLLLVTMMAVAGSAILAFSGPTSMFVLPWFGFALSVRSVFAAERSLSWRLARWSRAGGWWCAAAMPLTIPWLGLGSFTACASSVMLAVGGHMAEVHAIPATPTVPVARLRA